MTKLKVLYQQWNAEQRDFYRPVISALLDLGISTDKDLLKTNVEVLCSSIDVHRWPIKAFIQQVILDTSLLQETTLSPQSHSYFPTDFPDLNTLLEGGLCFKQITELCGSGQTQFIPHLLASFALSVSNQNMYVFGSTGVFEPKKTSEIFEKKGIDSKELLSQIEYTQVFSLQDLSLGLERLGALIASTESVVGLVVIENMSRLVVNHDWSSQTVQRLVEILDSLSRLGFCVFIQNTMSRTDLNERRSLETYWNPLIDLRLYLSKEGEGERIEIIKCRKKVRREIIVQTILIAFAIVIIIIVIITII